MSHLRFLARRRARWALGIALVLMVVWFAASCAAAWRLTHRLKPRSAEPAPGISWAEVETVTLRTSDGQELGAWLFNERGGSASIILLHGNGGSRRSSLPTAELLAEAGYSVLAITHRAHGDSSGTVNDFGRSAALDVIAAVEFLETRRPATPIFVHGSSLGAAAAVFASKSLERRVAAYVLECLFRDLRTAVRNRTAIHLPAPLDAVAYRSLLLVAPLVLDAPGEIAPIAAIRSIPPEVPVLILAGEADRHATIEEASELHEAIRSHSELVSFPGADHERLQESSPERYAEVLLRFLRERG